MSLRAAQLLFQPPDGASPPDLVERAASEDPAEQGDRTLALLTCGGWASVLEEGRTDLALARRLSERSAGPVFAVALDGARFRLQLRTYEEGRVRTELEEPAAAGGGLPLLSDVEQTAWERLRQAGVPPRLRLRAFGEVDFAPVEGGGDALLVRGPSGWRRSDGRAALHSREEGAFAPVEPDAIVESRAGEQRAIDLRVLPEGAEDGGWKEGAVESLCEVEEQLALRLCLELAEATEGPELPRPSIVYRGCGEALAAQLEAARAGRPWLAALQDPALAPPPSHAGYVAAARRLLESAAPGATLLRQHGLWLEWRAPREPGCTLRQHLAARYLAALLGEEEQPRAGTARAAPASHPLAADLLDLLSRPRGPVGALGREELWAGLLPALAPNPEAVARGRASAPFARRSEGEPGLSLGLLHEQEGRVAPVTAADLDAIGVGLDEALARALARLEGLSIAAPRGLTWFDLEQGRLASADYDDPAGAARLASPPFRALLEELLGGPFAVFVPTRDTLLACAVDAEEAVAWLAVEAARRFREGPFPLDPRGWLGSAARVEPLPPGA